MLPYNKEMNFLQYFGLLLFPILLINLLEISSFPGDVKDVGRFTIEYVLYLSAIILLIYTIIYFGKLYNNLIKFKHIYFSLGILGVIYLISHFQNENYVENTTLLYLFLTFTLTIIFINVQWTPNHVVSFGHIVNFVVLFLFLHWFVLDFPIGKFKSVFWNPNGLGIATFCLLFFQIIAIKYVHFGFKIYFIIFILMNLTVLYSTTSRAVFLALILVIASMLTYKLFNSMFSKLYFVVLPFVLIFVYFYVTLVNTPFGKQLNELSLKYFSKSFFSGRSELWEAIWQVGLKQPIFGHGIGLQPKEVTEFTLSSHNQYLQVFLETGFLGLIAFCILLFFIWKALLKNSHTYVGAWSACFFIGILFYQSMEYSLFINNLSLSYLQWLIITIGISFNER